MRGHTHAHTESRNLSHAPITENENLLRSLTLSLDHNTVNAVNPHTESTATHCIKFFLKTTRRRGHTLFHFRRAHVFLLTHALAYQKRCHLDLQELESKTEYGLPGANTALTHQLAPEKPIPLHMLVSDTNASTPSSVPNSHCKDCTSVSPGDIWSTRCRLRRLIPCSIWYMRRERQGPRMWVCGYKNDVGHLSLTQVKNVQC